MEAGAAVMGTFMNAEALPSRSAKLTMISPVRPAGTTSGAEYSPVPLSTSWPRVPALTMESKARPGTP
jgi:hypothetical protein